jgi:hypothetical protein
MEAIKDEPLPDDLKPRYEAPLLRHLGDLRLVTLGASGCVVDSGGTLQKHPINCP